VQRDSRVYGNDVGVGLPAQDDGDLADDVPGAEGRDHE